MGNTFEIKSWQYVEYPLKQSYKWVLCWRGESLIKALYNFYKIKKTNKHPCLKLEWR